MEFKEIEGLVCVTKDEENLVVEECGPGCCGPVEN